MTANNNNNTLVPVSNGEGATSSATNGTATTTTPEGKMRAFRCDLGATEPTLQYIDVPKVGPLDVLIKVVSVGLAPGVFNMLKKGIIAPLPTTLGHEVAGTVEQVGALVRGGVAVGQRVRVNSILSCGSCKYCTTDRHQMCQEGNGVIGFNRFGAKQTSPYFDEYHNGGMADYMRVPGEAVQALPDNVSFDVGAKVHDIANALRCLKVAALPPGASVIITGATGTMGTATVKLATFFGIDRLILIGRSAERLEAVKQLASPEIQVDTVSLVDLGEDWGTTKALSRRLLELAPDKVDAVVDYWPAGGDIWQSMAALCQNGVLVHMGGNHSQLPIPMIGLALNCWRIIGTRGNTATDQKTIVEWLARGRLQVDDLITHKWTLDQVDEAVIKLRDRSIAAWMIMINP